MHETLGLMPLIASKEAERIFALLRKVRPEHACGQMLDYLKQRADDAIAADSRKGIRMEHTIAPEYKPAGPLLQALALALLRSAGTFSGNPSGRCGNDFFAEPLPDGGAKLLHVRFCIERKPKFSFGNERFSPDHCIGYFSEMQEADLAKFLHSCDETVPQKTLNIKIGSQLEEALAIVVARPVSEALAQA